MSIQNAQKKFYDLHIYGIGYVYRIREVPVKRGDSFWACDIAALHGGEDAVEYTRFDCRVSGTEATKLIKRLDNACQEQKKILIRFKLGDLYAESFVYQKGEKQGETGISLKARLLIIGWIKVDGETSIQRRRNPIQTRPIILDLNPILNPNLTHHTGLNPNPPSPSIK